MKHKATTVILVLMAAGWITVTASGATPKVMEQVTFEQALDVAGRERPELAEARATVEAAEARREQAGKLPNPEVIARVESAPVAGRTLREADYLAGVSQTVPLGSRLSKAGEAERLDRERRLKESEARWRDIRRQVRGAFATALYQERVCQTQRTMVESTEKLVAISRARQAAGDAVRSDTARLEMELAHAKMELNRAETMRTQARQTLEAAMGDPAVTVRSVEGNLDETFAVPAMESLVAGIEEHPANQAADAEVRWQEARVELAKAGRVPDLNFELLYRRVEGERRNAFDVGIRLPLPLFDRGNGRVQESRAEVTAAEARSRSVRQALSLQARQSYTRLVAALANKSALKGDFLPKTEVVLKNYEARFSAGEIGLGEVLPVRREWAEGQLGYLESLRDVMQAWSDVEYLASSK